LIPGAVSERLRRDGMPGGSVGGGPFIRDIRRSLRVVWRDKKLYANHQT
jgi:hypothetical protein